MKPLIFSFFAVILGYSLLFDKEEVTNESMPIQAVENTVFMDEVDTTIVFTADSTNIYQNITASL